MRFICKTVTRVDLSSPARWSSTVTAGFSQVHLLFLSDGSGRSNMVSTTIYVITKCACRGRRGFAVDVSSAGLNGH